MADGDIRSINLRLKVPREGVAPTSKTLLLASGVNPEGFIVAGMEKVQSTGDELAEYIVTILQTQ